MTIRVGMVTKAMFFDRERIKRAMDRVTRVAFGFFGGDVRRAARASIKVKPYGAISPPGQPPFSHVEQGLAQRNKARRKEGLKPVKAGFGIRSIYFGLDPAKRSVVIGPQAKAGIGVVPPALEYGGASTNARGERITIRAHPFMGPAFEKITAKLARSWERARARAWK